LHIFWVKSPNKNFEDKKWKNPLKQKLARCVKKQLTSANSECMKWAASGRIISARNAEHVFQNLKKRNMRKRSTWQSAANLVVFQLSNSNMVIIMKHVPKNQNHANFVKNWFLLLSSTLIMNFAAVKPTNVKNAAIL